MFNQQNQGPYLNEQALPSHVVGSGKPGKLSRAEKKALKQAKKNGTLIGGEYIAPVAPREELFMGHQTINEIQKPGLATGYGIPEHGRAGSPLGLQGSPSRMMGSPSQYQTMGSPSRLAQNYTAQSLGGQ